MSLISNEHLSLTVKALKNLIDRIDTMPNDTEQLEMLAEADMLPAVHDTNGAILTDENGNIILRY